MSAVPSISAFSEPPGAFLPCGDQHVRDGIITLDAPLRLESGRMLDEVQIAYRLVGETFRPAVLVMGGISAGRYFWRRSDASGWWHDQFGPGRSGDTHRYAFVSFDFLGGNGESTGPGNWPGSDSAFPPISTADQAKAASILLDHIGVERLHSIIGASYGGMVALRFAALFPERVDRVLAFCAGHRASAMASGWRHVQRQVLDFGIANNDHSTAVRIARSLAMCTYRSEREFSRRFRADGGSPVTYLDHCGQSFAERFNIYAYRCLSQSIDDHRVVPSDISVPVDLAGFTTDQIVPPRQLQELRRGLAGGGALKLFDSPFGHDAFLKERGIVSTVIRRHLEGRS